MRLPFNRNALKLQEGIRNMETQPIQDYIIPDEDNKFLLLPDKQEVTFADLGGLRNHVQNEIAAWTNVENTIVNKYKLVLGKIEALVKGAKDGRIAPGMLAEVKKLLQEWNVNGNGINSCIDSRSRLGRYIKELCQRKLTPAVFRDYCIVTICVLGYPCPNLNFSLNIMPLLWEAARVAKSFACPEDLSERVEEYRKRLEDLTNSADAQQKDYQSRMTKFDIDTEEFKRKRREELDKEENEYAERLNKANERITALEAAYSKKLQLEGPALHWKHLSRFYLGWGWGLLVSSLLLGGVTIGGLLWLLVQADTIVIFNENKLSLSTIRASLILIAATPMAGHLLHLFTKLAISCFHLSRDYRERFQLTNVFLALLREGDVNCDDQVKQIVMQALFSRSDTGLLKGDHSFKMPGISEMLKSGEK